VIESFNGRMRDELLNQHWWRSIDEARRAAAAYREDYNRVRPHSRLGIQTPEQFASALRSLETLTAFVSELGSRSTLMDHLRMSLSRRTRAGARAVSALLTAAMVLLASRAGAQELLSPQPSSPETDGYVYAMSRVGDTLYIGGGFGLVGPCTGQGALVSLDEGRPAAIYPKVAGIVRAVVSDDGGGWFIGGDFVGVGGQPRAHLAHILSDGTVSPWAPNPDSTVRALLWSEGHLYVGGDFSHIAGTERHGVARFDLPFWRLSRWNPDVDGGVYAMVVHDRSVYLGGRFSSVGGAARGNLAEVDQGFGRLGDWNPDADREVDALAEHGDAIYAGGLFRTIAGADHPQLVALDRATGSAQPRRWRLQRIPDVPEFDSGPYVGVLVVHRDRLYIGGSFTHVDSIARGGVAAIDLHTQDVTDWDAHLINNDAPSPYCFALAIRDGVVYVGGRFVRVGPAVQRLYVAAVDEAKGDLLPWYPKANGFVRALTADAHAIYVGGEFSSLWSWQPRNNLAALDTHTGEVLPWNPNVNAAVGHMVVSGNTMYIGGAFDHVGGQPRLQIAALELTSGSPTAWNPGVTGYTSQAVWSMAMRRGTLFVGGWFYAMGGQPRENLAAVDSATGVVTDWNPGADDIVQAMATRGDTLFAGGWFEQIAGETRHLIAAFDTRSGNLYSWQTQPITGHIEALAVGDRALYVAGTLHSVGDALREGLAALDFRSAWVLPWRADAPDRAVTLAVSHGVVYAGGWFSSVGGQERHGAAAIDSETGEVLPWDPQAKAQAPGFPVIASLLPWDNTIYLGGEYEGVGLTPSNGLTWLSDAGTIVHPPYVSVPSEPGAGHRLLVELVPNPARNHATLRYSLPSPSPVSLAIFDLQGRRVASILSGESQSAGDHEVQVRTESWPAGSYFYRLEASGQSAMEKLLVIR